MYYDDFEQHAHQRYGTEVGKGAVVVLRPDGWVGTLVNLDPKAVRELEAYFEGIFVAV